MSMLEWKEIFNNYVWTSKCGGYVIENDGIPPLHFIALRRDQHEREFLGRYTTFEEATIRCEQHKGRQE